MPQNDSPMSTTTTSELIHSLHGRVLELRLNRPARLNALTHQLARELAKAVNDGMHNDQVRVILITAEGRGFCAGKDRDDPPTDGFVQTLQTLASGLLQGPKPVIAAVQGWAVGAGFELALGCDLIVAGTDARFKLPETPLGLPATGGIHMLLPSIVGTSRAKGLLWLGQEIHAEQAHQWGIVWELAEPADLRERALALAQTLAALPTEALVRVKRLVHAEHLPDVPAALGRESRP